MQQRVSILDVVDNFLAKHRVADFDRIPGRDLLKFGKEVRRFAASYDVPAADSVRVPMYIGGWPSANFYHADQGQLVLSTLLYSGQVYAKDPLSDWFAYERFTLDQLMASRQGFLDQDGRFNAGPTRGFLNVVVPALRRLRPLIESGALVLVPTMAFLAQHQEGVRQLRTLLEDRVCADLDALTGQFTPQDMAVDDRVRGMFTFAGGERELQLRKHIGRSLEYFAQEWLLAQRHGVEYTAPWSYEQFVCEHGLGRLMGDGSHQRVITGLLHTQLPLFQGLDPKVVADIRDDESFADFRASLLQVYKEIPRIGTSPKFVRELAQTEETLLRPVIERTEREARRGRFSRLGVTLAETAVSVAARVGYDVMMGDLSWKTAGRETVGTLSDLVRAKGASKPHTAWIKLHRHHRNVRDELKATVPQQAVGSGISPWHIDKNPSPNIRITPGILLIDDRPLPMPQQDIPDAGNGVEFCGCASGLTQAACCGTLPALSPGKIPPPPFWARRPS